MSLQVLPGNAGTKATNPNPLIRREAAQALALSFAFAETFAPTVATPALSAFPAIATEAATDT
eukprot:CAMPEP_0178431796 /NCGR_PEP_ID=MMETSP0689_2-20121128/32046_1 /TAXON_ID=160604 /ORGANISM="Amphidinium massartii, Strain CS-259" /LENGTH=62 /DNA_ID=CAMNT_0020053747 /DNA_START=303 /DNA_END=491 /DNA_ORIENTATION=-